MKTASSANPARSRPKLFRALGTDDPPTQIEVDNRTWYRTRIIKHDSWAATALYHSQDTPAHRDRIVCKFNRTQPIGLIPMRWLGKRLAHRESEMYRLLRDVNGIATGYQLVKANGRRLAHACAHDFIEGHPLRWHDVVDDQFFDHLDALLRELHCRDIAFVDMNKSENVIVDQQGRPNLIDFQISVCWPGRLRRGLLRVLQKSDLYHSFKLKTRFRPDLVAGEEEIRQRRPWWIRAHRMIANPFRTTRRRLLVALGIRKDTGKPHSESFIEEALRADTANGRESGDPSAVLRLYRLLRSQPYASRFDSPARYVAQMMDDLLGDLSRSPADQELARRIQPYSDHDKVVELLKSKTFFVSSRRWDPTWIEQRVQSIQATLAPEGWPNHAPHVNLHRPAA